MPILMFLYALTLGTITPLTDEEQLTKAQNERCYLFEQEMNGKGMGETWKHSQSQTQSADREIQK
ncbi:MAG TPA: hypothetical protein PLZ78_08885 [Spirochaetota bacterium]|nr:hypothetical protein [Spirochaetota bacterium]